jgi:hypothetical protein
LFEDRFPGSYLKGQKIKKKLHIDFERFRNPESAIMIL